MKTYTYSEARQRLATLLDQARREGQVRIVRQDGSTFVLQPVTPAKSPLDVPAVPSKLQAGELVDVLRSERERAGTSALDAIARRRRRPITTRAAVRKQPARKK